jgi:hypothetical protein
MFMLCHQKVEQKCNIQAASKRFENIGIRYLGRNVTYQIYVHDRIKNAFILRMFAAIHFRISLFSTILSTK